MYDVNLQGIFYLIDHTRVQIVHVLYIPSRTCCKIPNTSFTGKLSKFQTLKSFRSLNKLFLAYAPWPDKSWLC